MKTLKLLLLLLISTTVVSCSDNDNEPSPVVAPEVPNKLVGTRWIADPDNLNATIDNQRYVSYDPLLSNGKTHYIHNYTYDNGTLIVDGKDSYKIKGNKITMFDITFTKQ